MKNVATSGRLFTLSWCHNRKQRTQGFLGTWTGKLKAEHECSTGKI